MSSGYGVVRAEPIAGNKVRLYIHSGTSLERPLATVSFGTDWETCKFANIINSGYEGGHDGDA